MWSLKTRNWDFKKSWLVSGEEEIRIEKYVSAPLWEWQAAAPSGHRSQQRRGAEREAIEETN